MCYHKLYIFTTCGHSTYCPKPLLTCRHASIGPLSTYSEECELRAHPFQSLKIESLCSTCQRDRNTLLGRLESDQIVRFDEWRWKVSYSAAAAGLKTPSSAVFATAEHARRQKDEHGGRSGRWSWKKNRTPRRKS